MNQRVQALHATALESLDLAYQAQTVEVARVALHSALHATRALVRLGEVNPALPEAVNETRVALMARGWL
jgi:hypothetical protein